MQEYTYVTLLVWKHTSVGRLQHTPPNATHTHMSEDDYEHDAVAIPSSCACVKLRLQQRQSAVGNQPLTNDIKSRMKSVASEERPCDV